ncbi:MAG: cation acetate symporter [Gammaproteobacteria bacterium]|nr:cation acetate symporter [Gammaproteobacteria bacterium]MCY4211720.1 cation acetate symporter [Gammaproteobacteria bacterium]MCY4283624.1 cation acetate symporter [Gammaproteobacteria bacterium]MCY4338534.1 cation acetate symporter [Gammaproteobacteria bacterium]
MAELNYPAIATFSLFIVATLVITAYAARRTRSRKDFYVAGSAIGGIRNGIAISGDYLSAASFLGLVGLFFVGGYDTIFFIINMILSWVVVLLLIAEKLRNLGSYTFADAVSIRLEARPIRILAATGTLAVAVPYLLAQMVAAGTLFEALFGLSYVQGVLVVGVLMTVYVTFGGMLATTWVQIIKAALLVGGGTILAIGVLLAVDFNVNDLASQAVAAHPQGQAIMQPGLLYPDIVSVVSLSLAFIGGTAGLPHVLMRFFTVPDGVQARRSAAWAMGIISYFQLLVLVIGLGAIVLLTDNPAFTGGGLAVHGGSNMAAVHLSRIIGGNIFMGFICAVAFATILAVVSGLMLSAAATISHDLFAGVIRKGQCTDAEELRVSRLTVVVLSIVGILLAILFEGQNVAVLATLPLVIAASANFPVLFLCMYWKGFTTRGALYGGYTGLLLAVSLIILGPNVWVNVLGYEQPLFPYTYPTLFSMAACFLAAWLFSITDNSPRAAAEAAAFAAQMRRAQGYDETYHAWKNVYGDAATSGKGT